MLRKGGGERGAVLADNTAPLAVYWFFSFSRKETGILIPTDTVEM